MINTNFIKITQAYIDPGTGSMLFTVLIGLISAGIYAFRGLIIKLRYSFSKDKSKINDDTQAYVIYAESKRYWNIFKSVCDEFENRKIELAYLTSSKDDLCFNQKFKYVKPEYIGEGNPSFAKLNMLKANIVVSTTPSLDVYQWKRSKNVKYYVHIPHAVSDLTMYRMFGIDYYDAILTSNDFQIEQVRRLEELRNLPTKDMKAVGLTYFDSMKARLDLTEKTHNDVPVVLLAPSWGPSSILNKYGSKIIDSLIKTGYQIVVRPHPQSYTSEKDMLDNLMKKYPNIEWNKDNDNFDILNKADILISDFSGVIFDFSLVFDKPVIYADTSFDYSIYDAYWLNEEFWTFKVLPELGEQLKEESLSEIKSIIDNCLNDNKYQLGRNRVRNEAWFNIGNSAKDIVDFLVEKQKEVLTK